MIVTRAAVLTAWRCRATSHAVEPVQLRGAGGSNWRIAWHIASQPASQPAMPDGAKPYPNLDSEQYEALTQQFRDAAEHALQGSHRTLLAAYSNESDEDVELTKTNVSARRPPCMLSSAGWLRCGDGWLTRAARPVRTVRSIGSSATSAITSRTWTRCSQ
eukprot:COSAG06_NODE_1437_length_9464_cov_98.879445_3_plen_160_part_00